MSTGKISMETFFYFVGAVLLALPVILTLFTVFLMLTSPATEEEQIEDGTWGHDIDSLAKKRYNSNT